MWPGGSWTFRLGLIALATSFLIGCATAGSKPSCPPWPVAGPAVADELERGLAPAENYPATWMWLTRLDKLRDQLALCDDVNR